MISKSEYQGRIDIGKNSVGFKSCVYFRFVFFINLFLLIARDIVRLPDFFTHFSIKCHLISQFIPVHRNFVWGAA